MRLLRALALAALVIVAVPPVPVGAEDAGGFGVALVDAPVERRDDPRALTAIVDHVPTGTVIERRIRVVNHTDRSRPFDLYAGASTVRDGRWTPLDGRAVNEVTSWMTVHPTTLSVPAGSEAIANVTITVPHEAIGGERYAVVWAQAPPVTSGSVTQVARAGVRVYLSVGDLGEAAPVLDLGDLQAGRTDDGQPYLVAPISNPGRRALDVATTVTLDDEAAAVRAGPFAPTGPLILAPSTTASVRFDLPVALASGPWAVDLRAVVGDLQWHRTAIVTFPTDGEGTPIVDFPSPSPADAAAQLATSGPSAPESDMVRAANPDRRASAPAVILALFLIGAVATAGASQIRRRTPLTR